MLSHSRREVFLKPQELRHVFQSVTSIFARCYSIAAQDGHEILLEPHDRADGLAKLTLSDADGWKWTCELVPVGEDGATQFRGIATGTMKGAPTQTCTVFMR